MKTLTCIAIILFAPILAISKPVAGNTAKDKGKIEVIFTNKMTQEDLDTIEKEMKKRDIKLKYKKVKFDKDGYLKSISFKVDCGDGFEGSAKSSKLSPKKRFGFIRDYNEDGPVRFAVGNLP